MSTVRESRNSWVEGSSLLKTEPIENRAVSAEYLRWFTNVQQIEKGASTREVCEDIIKKVTVHTTLRYVEHALNFPGHAAINPLCTTAAPPSSPGPVDWFVSHSWDSPWHGLVEAVESHSKTFQEETTRYWVDILAICQHYGTKHQKEDLPDWGTPRASDSGFAKVLKTACESGGGLLLYYQPLLQPKALKRVWCLYEMHQALQFKFKSAETGVLTETINIEMSKDDRRDFEKKMRGDHFSEINQGLCAIDARTAEATVMSDWDNIVESILHSRAKNFSVEFKEHGRGFLLVPEDGHPDSGTKYYHNGWWMPKYNAWFFKKNEKESFLNTFNQEKTGFDGINKSIQNEMRRWLAVHTETLLEDVGVSKTNGGTGHGFYYRRSLSPSRPRSIDEGPSPNLTPFEKLNLEDPFWATKKNLIRSSISVPMIAVAAFSLGTVWSKASSDPSDFSEFSIHFILFIAFFLGGLVSLRIYPLIIFCRYRVCIHRGSDKAELPPNFPSVAARYFYKPNAVPWWLRARNACVMYYLGTVFYQSSVFVVVEAMIVIISVMYDLASGSACIEKMLSGMALAYKLTAIFGFLRSLFHAFTSLEDTSRTTMTDLHRLASAKLAAVSCRMQAADDDTVQREKVKQETCADIIAVMNILRSLKGGLVDVSTKLRLDMCRCIILSGMQLADDAEKMYLKGDPYQHASLYEKCLYFVSPDDEECAHRRFLKRKIFMAMAERTCPIDANSNAILWDDDILTELKQWPVSWIKKLSTEACVPSSMKADYRFKDLLRPGRRVVDSPRSVSTGRQHLVSCWSKPRLRKRGLLLAGITLVILFNLLLFGRPVDVIMVKCKTAPRHTNMTMTMPCYENITLLGC